MQGYNCIAVYSPDASRLLMCRRLKEPYKGLLNLVGGKIEPGEQGLDAAYRELYEETAVTREDISLTHLMDFTYYVAEQCVVEVYVGRLRRPMEVRGSENTLLWIPLDRDFFDSRFFAGEGNIGHILEIINQTKEQLLGL